MGNLKTPALCPQEPPRSCPLSNTSSPFLWSPATLHTDLSVPGLETNQLSSRVYFPENMTQIFLLSEKKKDTAAKEISELWDTKQ